MSQSLFGPYTVNDTAVTPGAFGIDDAKGNVVMAFLNGEVREWEGTEAQATAIASQLSVDDSVYLSLVDTHFNVPYSGVERVKAIISAAISALSIVAAANPSISTLQQVSASLNAAELILDAL